ncbi:MAG: efflux RND transporter periplasmic adaptor subunit, partial [Gemmatimonadota bacterium]
LIRPGMPADVTVAALPGRAFTGRIDYVYPTLAEGTRSMSARVVLPNPGGTLKPGMYATVRMTADLGETLTVPTSAVLQTGERAVAFVDMGGGELMPHELELGVRGGDFLQVLSGAGPGMRVVTSAHFLLDSESNLAEVMQAMMMQMGTSGTSGMEDMEGEADPMPGMDMDAGDSVRPDSTGGN